MAILCNLLATFIFFFSPMMANENFEDCEFYNEMYENPDLVAWLQDTNAKAHGEYLGRPRDYNAPLTTNEKSDIRYIITTLASKSLISIAKNRSQLEAAGDRIDHIHPLKFLLAVFTDEELKVGIRNIRGRGWVWNDFISGICQSFSTESSIGNLKLDFIQNFAALTKIQTMQIMTQIQNNRWEELVDVLIEIIPRNGDSGRYDN